MATTRAKNNNSYHHISNISLALVTSSGTDVACTFKWKSTDANYLDKMTVTWYYDISGKQFTGDSSTVEFDSNIAYDSKKKLKTFRVTYSPPTGSRAVRCRISTTGKSYEYGVYKNSSWSKTGTYKGGSSYSKWFNVNTLIAPVPDAPTVSLRTTGNTTEDQSIIDIELTNTDTYVKRLKFRVTKSDGKTVLRELGSFPFHSTKTDNTVKTSTTVPNGESYYVFGQTKGETSINKKTVTAWSGFSEASSKIVTPPLRPSNVKATASGDDGTTITITWDKSSTATSYEIAYVTDPSYFGSSDQMSTTSTSDASTTYIFANSSTLDTGKTWYFKVRAKNDSGNSPWSTEYAQLQIGKKPSAPTVWCLFSRLSTSDQPIIYWVHNATDGSSQTRAEVSLYTDTGKSTTVSWTNTRTGDEKDDTVEYTIPDDVLTTLDYKSGIKLYFQVRTQGVMQADAYWSDWSEAQTIEIYAPVTLSLLLTEGTSSSAVTSITTFPFRIHASAGPATQTPVAYSLTIFSNNSYSAMDEYGESEYINTGDQVYSLVKDSSNADETFELTPSDVDIVDGGMYTATCKVSMNSGLTCETSISFEAVMDYSDIEPQAIFGEVDTSNVSITICPFCIDSSQEPDSDDNYPLADNVTLSVYRINADNTFTEIASDVDNNRATWCIDPHPTLNGANYRIVALDNKNGNMVYTDLDTEPIGEALAPDPIPMIIQWDETWSAQDYGSEDNLISGDGDPSEDTWSGCIIKIPYNIDVTESTSKDTSSIEYIGRSHPVSYYGTQLGTNQTWKAEIPKTDTETLALLRQLNTYMGDVYVREPSGNGYWALVEVSFEQTHDGLTIPITFTLTQVEGDK